MAKLSIIIPSRDEPFLSQTVDDILKKATGDIEVIAILDGYWPNPPLHDDKRLIQFHRGTAMGMRNGIRSAFEIARGEYLMKTDAHCMFQEGFDELLQKNCEDNWIVIPRRYGLNKETWQRNEPTDEKPFVDYEYFIFPKRFKPISLHGFRWNSRTLEKENVLVDDTMTFQGSCWLMKRDHFARNNFMTDPGYKGFHKQEAEELGLSTWYSGGRVVVDKNVWYAHMHKKYPGYPVNRPLLEDCYKYSYQHWVTEQKDKFFELINKFWPVPSWPQNWSEQL